MLFDPFLFGVACLTFLLVFLWWRQFLDWDSSHSSHTNWIKTSLSANFLSSYLWSCQDMICNFGVFTSFFFFFASYCLFWPTPPTKTSCSNPLPINSPSPNSTAHSVIKSFSTRFHSDELIDCFHKSCLSILDIRGLPKSREWKWVKDSQCVSYERYKDLLDKNQK